MSFLNGQVLKTIARLRAGTGDAELAVGEQPNKRVLFIRKGELVGGVSDFPDERVGAMLAAAKMVDPALIDAVAKAAAAQGRMLGDALIAEGLITPTDLAAVLENQTYVRFERTLSMPGVVRERQLGTVRGVVRRPVGALLVAVFRDKLPPATIETLMIFAPATRYALNGKDTELNDLALTPSETRTLRRLGQGEELQQLLSTPQGEQAARLVLALLSLGVVRAVP